VPVVGAVATGTELAVADDDARGVAIACACKLWPVERWSVDGAASATLAPPESPASETAAGCFGSDQRNAFTHSSASAAATSSPPTNRRLDLPTVERMTKRQDVVA
jgi:hypothetical protein